MFGDHLVFQWGRGDRMHVAVHTRWPLASAATLKAMVMALE